MRELAFEQEIYLLPRNAKTWDRHALKNNDTQILKNQLQTLELQENIGQAHPKK